MGFSARLEPLHGKESKKKYENLLERSPGGFFLYSIYGQGIVPIPGLRWTVMEV
jgi:hypothetical protein